MQYGLHREPVRDLRRWVYDNLLSLETAQGQLTSRAADRLSMYTSGATPPAGPITVPQVGLWHSLGCYT